MNSQFERTINLLGEDNFNKLQEKRIAIFGLGGVGGTSFISLLRSGFIHFVLIDFDKVSISNLNRQLLYDLSSINKNKVDMAKQYALSINPDVDIKIINAKIDETNINMLDDFKVDFIIDAIDDVKGKIAITKYAIKNGIPFVVSLGMANRISSENVYVTKLNKTTTDPLAKKLRYEFKNNEIDLSKVNVVFSSEEPIKKQTTPYSMIMTPSSAGLAISSYLVRFFVEGN